jgi:hypothetical protein
MMLIECNVCGLKFDEGKICDVVIRTFTYKYGSKIYPKTKKIKVCSEECKVIDNIGFHYDTFSHNINSIIKHLVNNHGYNVDLIERSMNCEKGKRILTKLIKL